MAHLGTVRIYPVIAVHTGSNLTEATSRMLDEAWRTPGYCVPNADTYPHQWLWDSCFHALIWLELNPGRAVGELASALAHQLPSGFVPHMTYWHRPESARWFWGRGGTSTITQPPMYGHAVARLEAAGVPVPATMVARATAGLVHLLESRTRTPSGLVPIFHPWESGCDDSLRWCAADDPHWWRVHGRGQWRRTKRELVHALVFDRYGTPTGNDRFTIGSVGFNALLAWNARELATAVVRLDPDRGPSSVPTRRTGQRPLAAAAVNAETTADSVDRLISGADRLVAVIADRWDHGARTWLDDPVVSDDPAPRSPGLRLDPGAGTLDAMLALLVDPRPEAIAQLADEDGFAAPFGPRGVRRDQPGYDPDTYWRGPAWPQLGYLLWTAVERAGFGPEADHLRSRLVAGSIRSMLAEYWNPESGEGGGARPQSWTGLGLLAERAGEPGRGDHGRTAGSNVSRLVNHQNSDAPNGTAATP